MAGRTKRPLSFSPSGTQLSGELGRRASSAAASALGCSRRSTIAASAPADPSGRGGNTPPIVRGSKRASASESRPAAGAAVLKPPPMRAPGALPRPGAAYEPDAACAPPSGTAYVTGIGTPDILTPLASDWYLAHASELSAPILKGGDGERGAAGAFSANSNDSLSSTTPGDASPPVAAGGGFPPLRLPASDASAPFCSPRRPPRSSDDTPRAAVPSRGAPNAAGSRTCSAAGAGGASARRGEAPHASGRGRGGARRRAEP